MRSEIVTSPVNSIELAERREIVGVGVARLAVTFPQREIGAAVCQVYAEALDDIDPRDLEVAFKAVARFERWFPPPVVIREYAAEARRVRLHEEHRPEHEREAGWRMRPFWERDEARS